MKNVSRSRSAPPGRYPQASIAAYGPDATLATKLVVSVITRPGRRAPSAVRTWTTQAVDVRQDPTIAADVASFVHQQRSKDTVTYDRIIGCPHEEGIDYPMGRACPRCPFWAGIDRFTHEPVTPPVPTMAPAEILAALSSDPPAPPRAALESADGHRSVLVEPLLRAIDSGLANPPGATPEEAGLFAYALYLLAKWREPRAYACVVRWLSLPGEAPFEIAGDVVTQDGARILAAACDGDLEPIKALVVDRSANEYGRSAGVTALALLAAWAEAPREPIVAWFLWLAQEGVPTEYSVPVEAVAVADHRLIPFPGRMTALFIALLAALRTTIRSRLELAAEVLALRHQLAVLQRATLKRPRLRPIDRLVWVLLSSVWPNWRRAMQIVTPATVVRWHRRAFAAYWRWKSRPRRVGRPSLAPDLRTLIRQMRDANPLWGAPRIHGELQKLGIEVAQATVAKYLGRRSDPPSQSWRTFLTNHVSQLASIDFFTVPTATFRVLFVFVVLSHDRRRIVHVNVTAHPTAAWTGQQLREAWPWDTAPRFVIRDRDAIYGSDPRRTVQQMGIEEVLTAPRCPWQNPFVERVIGSLRRECLDHVIVLNERSLQRHLRRYLAYYNDVSYCPTSLCGGIA